MSRVERLIPLTPVYQVQPWVDTGQAPSMGKSAVRIVHPLSHTG